MSNWFAIPNGFPGAELNAAQTTLKTVPFSPDTDPLHRRCLERAVPCPIFHRIGHKVSIYCYFDFRNRERSADYDNRWATWMMIDPQSGFAPLAWQGQIGPVLVLREDGSLTSDDILVMTNWVSDMLDDWYRVRPSDLTRKAFDKYAHGRQHMSVNPRNLTI